MKTYNTIMTVFLVACTISLIGCISSKENESTGIAIRETNTIIVAPAPSPIATTLIPPTNTLANVPIGSAVAITVATTDQQDEPGSINLPNHVSLIAQNKSADEVNMESAFNLDIYDPNLYGDGSDIQLFETDNEAIFYYLKPINGALAYPYEGKPTNFRACRQNITLFSTDEIAVINTDMYLCVVTSLGYLAVVKIERLHPLGPGSVQLKFDASGMSPVPQETRTLLTANTDTSYP